MFRQGGLIGELVSAAAVCNLGRFCLTLGDSVPQARQKPRADDDPPISIDDSTSTAPLPHPAMALFVLPLSLYPMTPPTAQTTDVNEGSNAQFLTRCRGQVRDMRFTRTGSRNRTRFARLDIQTQRPIGGGNAYSGASEIIQMSHLAEELQARRLPAASGHRPRLPLRNLQTHRCLRYPSHHLRHHRTDLRIQCKVFCKGDMVMRCKLFWPAA